jgi:5-hydroxyisourate hydrolase-like protein (transthyretin family)
MQQNYDMRATRKSDDALFSRIIMATDKDDAESKFHAMLLAMGYQRSEYRISGNRPLFS